MKEFEFSPPRGMRDFYPEDMKIRNAIFDVWRFVARRHCFQEYDACVVEKLDLLKRKAGEEITEQIYHFSDKSGRELALRPEMTPTLARMIIARSNTLKFPVKWFCIAQCFRYERMSRGRKREHYQWNLDIVGEPSVTAEAELLTTASEALMSLGFTKSDFIININNRRLLGEIVEKGGITQSLWEALFLALDKRGKIPEKALQEMLSQIGLTSSQIEYVSQILQICSLKEVASIVGDYSPALKELQYLLELMNANGLADVVKFDISVVRGLSYYTGIVFECFDALHKFRAIFGGGRYDNLFSTMANCSLPAVGLGFGDVVISEILIERAYKPPSDSIDTIAIGYYSGTETLLAIKLANAFRKQGKSVNLSLHSEKPSVFFSRAGSSGAQYAVFVGPDEINSGILRIKNLETRTEEIRQMSDLLY